MDSVETRRLLGASPGVPRDRPFSMSVNRQWEIVYCTRDMPRVEICTLGLLQCWANNEGVIVATLDQIADAIHYDRGHVADALKALQGQGRLVKVKRAVYRIPPKMCTPANPAVRGIP